MTLAEQFKAAALKLRDGWYGDRESDIEEIAALLDRGAELARDNERVVQSIVTRKVTKDAK